MQMTQMYQNWTMVGTNPQHSAGDGLETAETANVRLKTRYLARFTKACEVVNKLKLDCTCPELIISQTFQFLPHSMQLKRYVTTRSGYNRQVHV